MSIAEMFYDMDVAMGIIESVGHDLYFDMIGGQQNAAWMQGLLDDDYGEFWMSDDDDDDDFDDFERKTFVTLQDSNVIQYLSFHQEVPGRFRLPNCHPHMEESYEDLNRLLEELELMAKTWRKRCDHPYTAHLRSDPQAADPESEHLRLGEDYSQSDYEFEEDEEDILFPSRIPVVPNENLTKKKFCQSVKTFQKIFSSDVQFEDFQRMIFKAKKYIFRTIFQVFMQTIPSDTAARLPQELWEKIWKYTQNGYFRYKGSVPLLADKTYYKAGQRFNKTTNKFLWELEQARLSELFGAVGNLHITLFEILFQSTPCKNLSGIVDDWEVNYTSEETNGNYRTLWVRHWSLFLQKYARLRQIDVFLAMADSGVEPRSLTTFQRVERGLFCVDELKSGDHSSSDQASRAGQQVDNTILQSGSDFYSRQQCKYFGFIGYEPPLEASNSEEYSLNVKLYDATTGKISHRIITNLKYSLFKLELAKFAPRRIGRTHWRRSLCLTEGRMSVMYCDTTLTKMHVKIWSSSLLNNGQDDQDPASGEASKTPAENIIRLNLPLIDDVVAENDEEDMEEDREPAVSSSKSKKKKESAHAKKTRELNKKDIKAAMFHSQNRIVVCLQNPYKAHETVLAVYCASTGEKYLDLNWPGEELSLVGFKDNLAILVNHTAGQVLILNTECGEPVLTLSFSDLNKTSSSYGPWLGLFDCNPSKSEFVLLRSDNSEYQLYSYDSTQDMKKPTLKQSGKILDKSLLGRDILDITLLKDGTLFFNKRTPVNLVDDAPGDGQVNCHEIACYDLDGQTYMPIIFMMKEDVDVHGRKYNEVNFKIVDSMQPKSFEVRRPIFSIQEDLVGQLDNIKVEQDNCTVRLCHLKEDELAVINHEVHQREQKEKEILAMKALMEEQLRENERRQRELAAKQSKDREEAYRTIVDKGVKVEGEVIEWRTTYGFLRTDGIASSLGRIFFHRSNIEKRGYGSYDKGTRFKYTISTGRDPGSFQAFNVILEKFPDKKQSQHQNSHSSNVNPHPSDVELVMQAAQVNRLRAREALKTSRNDVVLAVQMLTPAISGVYQMMPPSWM